jgi:hypothetical protein
MNKALGWHVTSHLVLDRLIAPSSETRRLAARTLLELSARYGLSAMNPPASGRWSP